MNLTPNIAERISRWHKTCENCDFLFDITVLPSNRVKLELKNLPEPKDVPHLSERTPNELIHKRLVAFRIVQLERCGVTFGVFRPMDTILSEEIIFTAHDTLPPKHYDKLSDRYHALVNGEH